VARRESDREDLMREATALSRRIALRLPGGQEPVVAGFRHQGGLSVYFGQEAAFHFDKDGRLRRAFLAGDLYRTQGTTLAQLRRVRSADNTQLVRNDLTHTELQVFLAGMDERLSHLQASLSAGQAAVLRVIPDDEEALISELFSTLERIADLEERLAPPIAGKR
jgi:hypothetical protein